MAETMKLEKRQVQAPAKVQRSQYLAFSLAGETFAMESRFVREVIQYGGLTVVPLMPSFVRGVINLRGAVVPVLDLNLRFGRTATETARRTCVVILEVGPPDETTLLGVLVDNVSEVLEIASGDIEPAPSFGHSLRADFVSGVGKVGGRFIILLDVNRVLSVEELASLTSERETGPSEEGSGHAP